MERGGRGIKAQARVGGLLSASVDSTPTLRSQQPLKGGNVSEALRVHSGCAQMQGIHTSMYTQTPVHRYTRTETGSHTQTQAHIPRAG